MGIGIVELWIASFCFVLGSHNMQEPSVVCTGPIDKNATEILHPHGRIVFTPDTKVESLQPLVGDAIALVVRGEAQINAQVIEAATELKVIGRTGVGYNNVDIAAATARKIPVVFTPGAGARAVAEAAVSFMLALCKRVCYWDNEMKAGNWQSRHGPYNRDLDGATLGIIGFGRIGRILASMVKPFNMTVLAHDPFVPATEAANLDVQLMPLEKLFAQSDFISIHAVVTDETRAMINRQLMKQIKRGAYLINLARGDLIESLDVIHEALTDGRLAGAALDVFAPEPPEVSHPIFKQANCLTSPHAMAMTEQSMARIFDSMAKDVAAVLEGKRPQHVVNPEVL